jgi:hypothetical protein
MNEPLVYFRPSRDGPERVIVIGGAIHSIRTLSSHEVLNHVRQALDAMAQSGEISTAEIVALRKAGGL